MSATVESKYPRAVDPDKVGTYPLLCKSGAGYVYDDVLEYRVWVHGGGDDTCKAFVSYEEAEAFSKLMDNAEPPLVLILQKEHINEPEPGKYEHIKDEEPRITEWRPEWLEGAKRGPGTIERRIKELTDEKVAE